MKIKLPRKRKKAYIKAHGSINYMAAQVVNEVIREDKEHKQYGKYPKFPEFIIVRNQVKVLFNW